MSSKDVIGFPQFRPPDNLPVDEQILMCVGTLVAAWANCETIMRSIYVCLVGRASQEASDFAEVAWLSFTSSKPTRDLLFRTVSSSSIPQNYRSEIIRLIDRFKHISDSRNFYCHAHYVVDSSGTLQAVESYRLKNNDQVMHFDRRTADKTMVNGLITAIDNCDTFNREASGLLSALHKQLQARFPVLPSWPDGFVIHPAFLRQP